MRVPAGLSVDALKKVKEAMRAKGYLFDIGYSKLNADLDARRQYYLNRGYMEFQVNSSQAALSADKKGIDITVNVTEGPRYVVSGVSLSGNYLEKEDEFKSLVKIKPGAPYKQSDVDDTVKAMTEHFGTYG